MAVNSQSTSQTPTLSDLEEFKECDIFDLLYNSVCGEDCYIRLNLHGFLSITSNMFRRIMLFLRKRFGMTTIEGINYNNSIDPITLEYTHCSDDEFRKQNDHIFATVIMLVRDTDILDDVIMNPDDMGWFMYTFRDSYVNEINRSALALKEGLIKLFDWKQKKLQKEGKIKDLYDFQGFTV